MKSRNITIDNDSSFNESISVNGKQVLGSVNYNNSVEHFQHYSEDSIARKFKKFVKLNGSPFGEKLNGISETNKKKGVVLLIKAAYV